VWSTDQSEFQKMVMVTFHKVLASADDLPFSGSWQFFIYPNDKDKIEM